MLEMKENVIGRLLIGAVVLLSLLATSSLAGQSVRGQVLDSVSGSPVARGFVVLVDEQGKELARTLSTNTGRFFIQVGVTGRYRIRSERIGYRAWESDLFVVGPAESVELELRVTAIPVQLEKIEVRGESVCRATSQDVDAGALWEEARKALAAASWAQASGLYRYSVHRFAVTRLRGRTPTVDVSVGYLTTSLPFQAVDLDRLTEEGYVIHEKNDTWVYYGPDANVLLDERFQTHCFGTVRGKGDFAGMLGLKFRPGSDRPITDIEGVLWIDAESSELRQIEYTYTRLPFSVRGRGVGGSISFASMESGAWIINDWVIRMPVGTDSRTISSVGQRGVRVGRVRSGMYHRGSRVIEAYNMDGELEYVHPDAVHVRGTVFDSILEGPLPNERVFVAGTGYETITNEKGDFAFNTLLDGKYELTAERIDSLGYEPSVAELRFVPGDTLTANLVIPSLATVHEKLCPDVKYGDRRYVLIGRLEDLEGETHMPRRYVVASWSTGTRLRHMKQRTDREGRFVFCDLPDERNIELAVHDADYTSEPVSVFFSGRSVVQVTQSSVRRFQALDRIWRVDLIPALAEGLVPLTPPVVGIQQTIHGTVGRVDNGDRIDRVAVLLMGTDGAVYGAVLSDSVGRFKIDVPAPGDYTIRVQRFGYNATRSGMISVPANAAVQIRVNLRPDPEMLETVTVTGERERFAPGPLRGFYDRKRRGLGHFLTREQIEEKGVNRFTSLLRLMHGVRIVSLGGSRSGVRMRGFGGLTGASCIPLLYWDGVKTGKIDGITDLGPDGVLFPSDLEAIEVYTPSSVPGEFGGSDARCGVIVVWSRRSP